MATKKKNETKKVEPTVKDTVQPKVEPIAEVKAVEVEKVIEPLTPVVEEVEKPIIVEEVKAEVAQPIIASQDESELTIEEKIVKFVNSRDGEIKLNSFLKSLYPRPAFNEPEIYLRQGESKAIKQTIQKLIDRNEFAVKGDTHKLLGSFYYTDGDTKTKYHNINTLDIIVNK